MGFRRRLSLTGSALSSTLTRWTQPGFVKRVQRGTIAITGATSNTATITAVDVNNARLRLLGFVNSSGADTEAQSLALLTLTNATTITASVNTSPGADTVTASFEITEYYPGVIKSVQRGTVVVGTPATITAINTLKTDLDWLGCKSDAASVILALSSYIVLTNSTTITATPGTVSGTQTSGYQAIEWF